MLANDIKKALVDALPILECIPLFAVTAQCCFARTFIASNTLFFVVQAFPALCIESWDVIKVEILFASPDTYFPDIL